MTPPRLTCDGKPLPLGPRIGRGGEGEIFGVADNSGRAVKIYLHPDANREAKVRAMIASHVATACPDVAFPHGLVRFADGRFAGFTMAQVTDHQPIHELIGASSRRQFFPGADWRFLVRVAVNIAKVLANVHATGAVVGDINSAGFLVSQRGTVKLIDADSFQIGSHRCRVGMPEYTPPELQGVPLGDVDRTTHHDAFGLAVLLFQVLMLGRHPFAGVVRGRPIPLDRAVGEGRFAFSCIADTGIKPPPRSLLLTDLPRAIRLLFERAFLSRVSPRPSATKWVGALSELESALVTCPINAGHVVPPISSTCSWCRIERETKRPIFEAQTPKSASAVSSLPGGLRTEVEEMIFQARRQAGEGIEPPWYARIAKPSKAVCDFVAAGGGSKESAATGRLLDRRHDAITEAERALKRWRTALGIWEVGRLSEELKGSVAALDRFQVRQPFLLKIAVTRGLDLQIGKIMASRQLAASGVAGVGASLVDKLERHGIVSAADLMRDRLAAISGVGEKRIVGLLFWRDSLAVAAEAEVRRSARSMKAASVEASARIEQQGASLERGVRSRLADLKSAVQLVQARASCTDATLASALWLRDQAAADIALLRRQTSTVASTNPVLGRKVPPSATKSGKMKKSGGKKKAAKGCPCCGAPMVKRWSNVQDKSSTRYGCSSYPSCDGSRLVTRRGGRP